MRCPASASALGRASRLADRCAKNPSLFPPQAAVGILALNRTHCDALGEVLLEDEEDDDDRHCGQCGTGHDQAEVGAVLCLQFCNAQRNGQVAGAGQHDQLHEVVVPAVDEGEDGQRTNARFDHRQNDADKGLCFARTVDAGRFQHFGGDALTELFHQKDTERPADDGEDDGPDGVVQVQGAHLPQKGNQNDLLGQRHGADDEGKQHLAADEALLGQSIARHGGGDAGQDHGGDSHEHGVDHPAQRSRSRGTDGEIDGLAVAAEPCAEGDGQLPQRSALAREQLLVVGQHPLMGPPLRGGGVDGSAGLERTGDDPIQRESERHRNDADQDQRQDGVGAGFLELAGVPLQRLLFLFSCTHCLAPPLIVLIAQFELDRRQDCDDDRQHNAHCIAVAVAVQLECGVVDVVHDGVGAVVGAAGRQQLDQCEALEGVDGGDDQDVQGGGHDGGPLDLPERLEIVGTVHFGCLDDGLVHVAQCGDVQNDGLAHGGSQQDEDDAAQSEPLIAQPVDVLVDEAERFAQIVEDAVVVVVHPLPHDGNGDRTGDDGEIEHAAEEAGGPLRQIDDGRADPQRERAGNRHGDHDDDDGIFQCADEDGVCEQLFVVRQADEDVGAIHGGIEEARDHAQDHGVDDESQEEDQAGQKKEVGCDGLLPDQCAAALRLLDRCSLCSQENHQTFRFDRLPTDFLQKNCPSLAGIFEEGARVLSRDDGQDGVCSLCLSSSGSVCILNEGRNGLLDGLAGADALQHVPPLGTSRCPARSDLVVVAQVGHELGVLAHDVVAGVDVANALTNGEVGGSQNACADLVGVCCDEVDEGLGCFDLGLVAVVKDAEAPDTAAQLRVTALGGKGHGEDLVAAVGQTGVVVVGVQLLCDVPAECHLQRAVAEQGDLLAAVDGSIKVDALCIVQSLDGLDVFGGVSSVLGVGCIGEGAAVHVVDDGAGALVAALAAAINGCDVLVTAIVQCVNGLQEAVGAPGVLVGINILVCAHFLDLGHVDGHAVCGHAQGILVVVTGLVLAGGLDRCVDILLGIVGPQIVQGSHDALLAPVCDQTLRAFHDQVGCAAALDGGVDLVVAVGVVQILDGDLDIRILCVEAGDQLLHSLILAPAADGVCPQLDACTGRSGAGSSCGRGGRRRCGAGRRGTAACGQCACCAQDAGSLQEGATRDTVFHNEILLAYHMFAAYRVEPLLLPLL